MKKKSTQKEKSKFRQSVKWKKYRNYRKKKDKIDCITLFPLRKGWNLHHLDLNEEHYEDLSDDSHFKPLNKKTHDTIHFLYNYYVKDEKIIRRIEILLKKMKEINEK